MSNAPVDAANVPVFTGQLSVLDEKVKALSADGGALANAGSSVHTTFGGMSAYYQAPEAEQLFAVTKPVVDITLSFSSDMCTIAGALGTYAQEIRPLVKKLEELKAEAASFQSKVSREEDWIEDEDLIDENLARRNEIAEVWAQFQTAERHAHDKIVALVCGAPLKVNDGSNGEGMYGYDAEALKQSKSLPWGDAVQESVPAWQVWEHVYDFGKGVLVDGVWGTIKGLGTLVGFDGWDAAGQAWTGLGKLATGVIITATPAAAVFWLADDKDLPPWIRDSRTAMKETGKALLAWDQWGSNPSRAAGAVTFNVVTTVFTGGTGGAAAGVGKAGLAAKTLSLAGKAGRAIDPMTYVFKGAGAGVSKIGDVMAGLKNMGKIEVPKIDEGAFSLPDGAVELPDGTIQLPKGTPTPEGAIKVSDGTIKLPEGTASLPPGTVKWPFDGPAKYADEAGNLYKEDGSLFQKADEATPEPSPKIDTGANPSRTEVPIPREAPVLAGVGGRGDDVVRVGSDLSDPVRAVDNGAHGLDNTPTGRAGDHTPGGHAPDGMPRNSADNHSPGTGGHPERPSTAGHTDGPGAGHGHGDHDLPGGSAADNGLPGHGGGGDAGSAGDDVARSADDVAGEGPGSGAGAQGAGGGTPEVPDFLAGVPDDFRASSLLNREGPLPSPGYGDKFLGTIDPSRIRTEGGLITHVDGHSVATFTQALSRERTLAYIDAKTTGAFPKTQTGQCVGVVMDMRTGKVYEGINGPGDHLIPLEDLHPTLRPRFDEIEGNPPHPAQILEHAEVKAANRLLWERTKAGEIDDLTALPEMHASVYFPFMKEANDAGVKVPPRRAPFCANCAHMLQDVEGGFGRFTGFPPDMNTNFQAW
ncbi:hypothetical protein [Streptomyces erythrochromogenes]|uniref:hypothetical protein n=1 Tax=Streptomyces erythrochromogenes TaxID=285574 RepID=UPI00386DA2CE|nr:YwqJ-related putative deaminase [Streptomyces erythrochromogenes]